MGKLYVGNSGSTPAVIKIKTKFGASADTWIGDVDENGTLNSTTWTGSLNFAGVKTIGNSVLDNMFSGFTGITGVDLSSVESVSERGLFSAFNDCTSITGALDLSALQTVGEDGLYRAFQNCTGITSVDLSSLQVIGEEGLSTAFYGCTSLTNVDLSSLTTVEQRGLSSAFHDCVGLTNVDLSSLTTIGYFGFSSAFYGCTGLTSIDLHSLTTVEEGGGLYHAFSCCTGLTSIDLSSLQSVGSQGLNYAFYGCTGLTNIDLSSLQSVGQSGLSYAFDDCTGITSVDLSSLQTAEDKGLNQAFYNCVGLTDVDLSSLQSVGNQGLYNAFRGCTRLTNIDLSSLQSVGKDGLEDAFRGCTSITSVDLSSLQTVGIEGMYDAFRDCTGLVSIDLSSLQSVGEDGLYHAFYGCAGLTTISFSSLTDVQTDSFGTSSSSYVFSGCTNLTEIHFLPFMQTTIETLTGYANKWGATNATIYFDLNNEEFPTINVIASQDVLIEINGTRTNVISAPINTQLTIKAKKEGYLTLTLTHVVSESCDIQITDDMFIPIPSEYNINYNNMNDNLLLLSSLVDGSNFIISDELCGIVNGDSSFNKNNGYSSGNLAIRPLSDCTLSITCEVSSESNYDFGAVYVGDSYYTPSLSAIKNNTVPENIIKLFSGSGIIAPQTYTTQLNANQTYYISFVYAKDSGMNSNKDRMIITEIKTEPISV